MGKPAWSKVRDLITSGKDVTAVLSHFSHCEVQGTYHLAWNLMHYAIIADRIDVMKHLFKRGLFTYFHSSETVSYLHVACALGRSEMLKLLLQTRPQDFDDSIRIYRQCFAEVIYQAPNDADGNEITEEEVELCANFGKNITAFGVAVLYRQQKCIEIYLKSCPRSPMFGGNKDLGKVVAFISKEVSDKKRAEVLQNLFRSIKFKASSINRGFIEALKHQGPSTVEVLLQKFTKRQLGGGPDFNPYHYVYAYEDWCIGGYGTALECTQKLIQDGWDVRVVQEPGTYPLYGLIWDAAAYPEDGDFGAPNAKLKESIACIKELLAAGADPNFNDRPILSVESPVKEFDIKQVPVSCAAEVLVRIVFPRGAQHQLVAMFAAQIIELLTLYDTDMSYTDVSDFSVLHHAMSFVIRALEGGFVDAKLLSLLSEAIGNLILLGADLQSHTRNKVFPLMYIMDHFADKCVTGPGVSGRVVNAALREQERQANNATSEEGRTNNAASEEGRTNNVASGEVRTNIESPVNAAINEEEVSETEFDEDEEGWVTEESEEEEEESESESEEEMCEDDDWLGWVTEDEEDQLASWVGDLLSYNRQNQRPKSAEDWGVLCSRMKQMFCLLDAMECREMYNVSKYCHLRLVTDLSDTFPEEEGQSLINELQSYQSVRSLYHLCRIKVWRYCGHRMKNLKKLHLPQSVQDHIKDLFFIPGWKC